MCIASGEWKQTVARSDGMQYSMKMANLLFMSRECERIDWHDDYSFDA